MTPEERAAKLTAEPIVSAQELTAAIRNAENAAIERAAVLLEGCTLQPPAVLAGKVRGLKS